MTDLIGTPLDLAVAKAIGQPLEEHQGSHYVPGHCGDSWTSAQYRASLRRWNPSTNPDQGHPLIERYGIALRRHSSGTWYAISSADLGDSQQTNWAEYTARGGKRYGTQSYETHKRLQRAEGPTALVAAMRCILLIEEPRYEQAH